MAPKRKPLSSLRRSARNYRLNPESRQKKNAYQRKRNKTTENKNIEPNLTVPGGRLGNTAKAVRIFPTLNQED